MGNAPTTRASLLFRLRDSADQKAWEQFVGIYAPLIHGFCCHRGLQDADAADVTQEVMKALARNMPAFEYEPDKGKFRSWLFTVTRNKFNNFLERRRHQPQGTGETSMLKKIEAQPCPETDDRWERDFEQRVFHWACREVQGEFQKTTWQAFWRTAVENEPGSDVAQSLGLSVGAVYIAKSRVLARLREKAQEASGDTALLFKGN
jgi:RNA polymerase sigma factor (sigma-70 family)